MCEILIIEYICRHTHTHTPAQSGSYFCWHTNHTPNICLLSRMTTHLCGPTCGMPDAPLSSFYWLSEWLFVCVCVSVVLLVSGYRDRAMCRNGPLHFLAGRPDLSGSASITTWNLNVKQPPHYSHLSFSVGQSAWTLALQHKHAHLLLFVHTQIYSAGRKWHLLAQI